jgi:hypothetical protein
MKKVVRLTESDIENIVKKLIKESEDLNEVGGYDDPFQMSRYIGGYMGQLKNHMDTLINTLMDLSDLSHDILEDEVREELHQLLNNISDPIEEFNDRLIDFDSDNMDKMKKWDK